MHKIGIFYRKYKHNNCFKVHFFAAQTIVFQTLCNIIRNYSKVIYFFVFSRKYLCIADILDMMYNKFGTTVFIKGEQR